MKLYCSCHAEHLLELVLSRICKYANLCQNVISVFVNGQPAEFVDFIKDE